MRNHSAEAYAAYPDTVSLEGKVYHAGEFTIELRKAHDLGWDARQPEVDALQARLDQVVTTLAVIKAIHNLRQHHSV